MATKTYKWRANTTFDSDTSLSYGVTPEDHTSWESAEPGSKNGTWTYWYRDTNVRGPSGYTDANSSRVAISLTESWTASIDSRNNLTVTITTTVNSVVRDDLRGTNQDTPGRTINIYREEGGTAILSLSDYQLASAHTIYEGPRVLETYTFTLAPGESLSRSSLYLHNQTVGESSYDDIWFGVQFMNDLPADFRPGATLDTNTGVWKSHNRTNGACHVLPNTTGTNWHECRTIGEGDVCGDPPALYHNSKWFNQRLLGKE